MAIVALVGSRIGEIHRFIDSDSLYSADLARDLVDGRLRGWIFQPAPSFFPDGMISAALHLVSPTTDFVYLAYPLVTGVLLYLLVRHAIGILYPRQSAATQRWCAFAGVAGVVCPTLARTTTSFQSLFAMTLGPNFHGGIVLTGLAVILLTHRALVQQQWSFRTLAAAWVVTFASTLSDKLMIPQGILPAALLTAWIVVTCPGGRTRSILWGCSLGSSTIAALTVEGHFADWGIGIGRAGQPEFRMTGLSRAISYLPELLIAYPAWGVSLVAVATASFFGSMKKRGVGGCEQKSDAAALRWTLTSMAVISALACALLAFTDPYEFRRMLPAFAIPILFAPSAVTNMVKGAGSRAPNRSIRCALTVAFAGVIASITSVLTTSANAFDPSLDRPALVTCLDQLRTDGILDAGLANFWNSRLIVLLSRTGINHVALWTDGEPFRSSLSLRTSLGGDAANHSGGPINVNYIVPQGLDRAIVLQRYGHPSQTLRCADQDVWVYPEGALRPHVEEIRQQAALRITLG